MNARNRERIEGRVRDLVQSGDAVIETASGLVFARGALPGERVLLSLEPKHGRVRRARVQAVLEPSDARVEPACVHASRCGGCPWMSLALEEQHQLKQRFLRDALLKAGAAPELEVRFTAADPVLHYRRRARLAFRVARGARQLGFRRERSSEPIDIDRCEVLEPVLAEAFAALRAQLLPLLEGEGELLLARGQRGGAVIVLRSASAQPPALYAACERLVSSGCVEGIALSLAGASKPAIFGAPTEWSEGADGAPLEGTLGGFSQAHAQVNRALVARVAELAATEGARVLELYAGHGNLSLALAPGAAAYAAVEQDAQALEALRRNLAARGLTAKLVAAQVEKQLAGGPLDVVVLDPPRTGASGVLEALLPRKPKRVVYVSCDPATLARDVGSVLGRGYAIHWAEGFDMFPQTAELESVVLLVRG